MHSSLRKEPAQTETVIDLQFINFIGIYVYDVLACLRILQLSIYNFFHTLSLICKDNNNL